MRRFLFALTFVLLPHVLWAQPIHGHPQKAAYASPAEYPSIEPQCHWAPGEMPIAADPTGLIVLDLAAGTLGNSTLAHTHFQLIKCPLYAELDGPVTCNFAVKLFHTTGRAYLVNEYQEGVRDIVWDATGTSTSPALIGDPMAIKVWTGHLTLDPTLPTRWHTLRGWWSPLIKVGTFYDNGDQIDQRAFASFYSVLDPAAPDTGGMPMVGSHCAPFSARHPNDKWGDNLVDVYGYLPLAPIDAPWPNRVGTAGYGGQLFNATFEQRADIDLHNHNGGTLLKTITQTGNIDVDMVLDPGVLGTGTHKVAALRNQLSSEGNDAVNTLLTFDVTVGVAPPQPTTCQDPTATNNGGPLPCVYLPPPPPPPPSETFSLATVEMSNLGRVKVCLSGVCVFVPILP